MENTPVPFARPKSESKTTASQWIMAAILNSCFTEADTRQKHNPHRTAGMEDSALT
jgi:hypothetical protein